MAKFKTYNQNQPMLLPLDVRECLPEDHVCYMINDACEQLDISAIEKTYSEEGSSAYSPLMFLKVIFYAYLQGIRSSRKIEAKLYEDNAFRYLAANQHPDHGTINLFRKDRLDDLENIFIQIVLLCNGLGMIDPSDISIDGSKYKANASLDKTLNQERIIKLKRKLKKKMRQILEEAEKVDQEEDKKYGSKRGYHQMPEKLVNPEERRREIKRLKEKLLKVERGEKSIKERQQKAKNQKERKLSKNSTYNLTDPQANLMPMKRNKSFQPAFNGQIATNNQVITSYDLTSSAEDGNSLLPLIRKTEKNTGQKVEKVKADSAYFSQDNLQELAARKIEGYIPDPEQIEKEQLKKKGKKISLYDRRNFSYDAKKNQFICPQTKRLSFLNYDANKRANKYTCPNCPQCPKKTECTRGKNRYLFHNPKLEKYKKAMRQKLKTKEGRNKYLERLSEVEPVIGNIKSNQKFQEFSCRGKPKALIEFGLVCIAHNFTKIFNYLKKTKNNLQNRQLNSLIRVKTIA
ncbi:MAG: IS1182 family transposase [Patescibacteria group bacterium]